MVQEFLLSYNCSLKVAAILWGIVRDSDVPKVYNRKLVELYQEDISMFLKRKKGIQLLAQKEELADTFQKIKDSKNKNLSRAFNQVFIIASLIVLLTSPLAYLTDKKVKE